MMSSLLRPAILVCGCLLLAEPLFASQEETASAEQEATTLPIDALKIEPASDQGLEMVGSDARLQLLVTGVRGSDIPVDETRVAEFQTEPAGIVSVDETGLVTPLQDGTARVIATAAGQTTAIKVSVEDFANRRPVDFENQIVPIFTKLGCNGGGCHGKSSGQNGFRLSLLGFYPEDDYEFLVKESRGRRIFPTAPEQSLLLLKPIGESPHGGGKRMEKGSYEYNTLLRWITQGMPNSPDDDAVVTQIECIPATRVMDRNQQQQIAVYATYSDGTRTDVTRLALYEPNVAELATSSETGLISTGDLSGEVAIMARFQGQVATFRATVPLGAEVTETPPVRNLVDQAVFDKLKVLGIPPSQLCDDSTFLRRVSLDITGSLPTAGEVRTFLADSSPDKRERVIDELLDSEEYADYFANKWSMILRNKNRNGVDREGTYEFHQWIWDQLYDNTSYDEFVRQIVTASGDPHLNPPVVWYREVRESSEQVEDVAQLFLGMRIQCARCHHHPFEKWSQDDYYGLAAFFSRIGKKDLGAEAARNDRDRRVFHNEGVAQATNPRKGTSLRPSGLGTEAFEIPADRDPRFYLADWMARPDNPFFAKALVNRYWKHFFGRGIVDPEDDMRETNPPSNPELLDALAQDFIASGFDLKHLVRTICLSSTYQLSALPNEYNLKDKQNFSRYYPKRLTAESLYDAFHQVTGTHENFDHMPAGTTAVSLPDTSGGPYFLKVFGQPQADTACECERSQDANLAQSLHLLNSSEVQGKISQDAGRAHQLANQSERSHADRISELYLWVYARECTPDELQVAQNYISDHSDNVPAAYEDILWALINTKEFLFNH